jgi:ATP-dependent helicase HrpB
LSGPLLDILAWGGDPSSIEWFEPPTPEAIGAAFDLLERLGATTTRRLTLLGGRMQQLPLHPRLARVLLAAGGSRDAAVACAVLSERHFFPSAGPAPPTTTSDLLSTVERERDLPAHVLRVADSLRAVIAQTSRRGSSEAAFRQAVLAGYPDRVARRREPGSSRFVMASGHGAILTSESGVRDAEFVVALDVAAGPKGEGSEARVRMASAVDRAWLTPSSSRIDHVLSDNGIVRAVSRDCYGQSCWQSGRPILIPSSSVSCWRRPTSSEGCRMTISRFCAACVLQGSTSMPGSLSNRRPAGDGPSATSTFPPASLGTTGTSSSMLRRMP